MTVIVAKVGVGMASDTGIFSHNVYSTGNRKIWSVRGGALFGSFGTYHLGKKFSDYFNGIGKLPDPNITEDDVVGLFLTPGTDGRVFVVEHDATLTPIHRPYYAIGAGGEYSLGALYMGADLKTAVLAAKEFCQFVAGEPNVVEFDRSTDECPGGKN